MSHPPSVERPNLGEWKCETCGTVYAEYINGCPHCWEAGLRSKVLATGEAQHPEPKARNLGELREQLVKWLHAKRQIWEQNKADEAETCIDCCNEIDIDILPIIKQREREGVSKFRSKAEFYFSYWMNQGYDAHSCVRMGMDDAERELAKLKSQPKVQAGEGNET